MVKVLGDAVFLPLTRKAAHLPRRFALVDIEDVERVSRSKWYATHGGKQTYVHATSLKFLPKHHELLHAYIMRVEPGQRVDHISGDLFDNRKQSLRIATPGQNAKNAKRQTFPGKTSRFKGVCWDRLQERWLVRITADGVRSDLGHFDEEADAARAYDTAALHLHGEFARTNETMRLFEMEDPFVPNCSWAEIYTGNKHVSEFNIHRHVLDPLNSKQRLDAEIFAEYAPPRVPPAGKRYQSVSARWSTRSAG